MGKLDYSQGCVNFRDPGEWINIIAGKEILPIGRILRGGKLDFVQTSGEIDDPGSIFNLRNGPDSAEKVFHADYFHFPTSNDLEKYETGNRIVRRWLNHIFAAMEREVSRFPVLFHCTSGKDRTGVVVGALLKILNIPDQFIVEEYLLSDGGVQKEWIESALNGIGPLENYFNRVDLNRLRNKVFRSK